MWYKTLIESGCEIVQVVAHRPNELLETKESSTVPGALNGNWTVISRMKDCNCEDGDFRDERERSLI